MEWSQVQPEACRSSTCSGPATAMHTGGCRAPGWTVAPSYPMAGASPEGVVVGAQVEDSEGPCRIADSPSRGVQTLS